MSYHEYHASHVFSCFIHQPLFPKSLSSKYPFTSFLLLYLCLYCMKDIVPINQNSRLLKKHFRSFNPIFGDPYDANRFLFDVKGCNKAYLPTVLKKYPLISNLLKSGSIAKFNRSDYYRNNLHSISQAFSRLEYLRLRYDFLYWISKRFPGSSISLIGTFHLIRELQKARITNKPIRLIIRKFKNQDISQILDLFILWCKEYSPVSTNVLKVSPSAASAKQHKTDLLELSDSAILPVIKLRKSSACSLYSRSTNSKYFFFSANNPNHCRGLNFSFILFHDMDKWIENKNILTPHKVFKAAFPVVLTKPETAIILEASPSKKMSSFNLEWKDATNHKSCFTTITIPWWHSTLNIRKFDLFEDKINFFHNLISYRKKKRFPNFPNVDGRILFTLWQSGLPLEAIHWYASESLCYKSPSSFRSSFPS